MSPCLVYQQRIGGVPCAAAFVAANGAATLLGVTRQLVGESWLGGQKFQYAGSIGPLVLNDDTLAVLAHCGNVLAEQFELIGLIGVDFILDGERVWILEVNPRYVASVEIIERATGIRAIEAHATACREAGSGEQGAGSLSSTAPRAPRRSLLAPRSSLLSHGKAILFAKRDVVISEPFAAMALAEASRQPWPTLADVSAAGTLIETGRPVLTVFAKGATVDEVESRLRERVATLEHKLYAG